MEYFVLLPCVDVVLQSVDKTEDVDIMFHINDSVHLLLQKIANQSEYL